MTEQNRLEKAKLEIENVEGKVNPHLVRNRLIELEKGFEIHKLDPTVLVMAERFDVIAKYVYALFWTKRLQSGWGEELYSSHIYAFNRYKEGDGLGKSGKAEFLNSFDKLLQSIRDSGFSENVSMVPVSPSNIVIDGSHRAAACLAYHIPITCVLLKEHISNQYNYEYFLRRGLELKYADFMAFEYCKLKKNTYVAVVFPSAIGGWSEINSILEESGSIVYAKKANFSSRGIFNLVSQIYDGEPWCGSQKDSFEGIREKSNSCFSSGRETRVFLIESDSLEKVKEAKIKIRTFFKIGNHSIHISDYHEESVEMAKMLFNENSIHFTNHAEIGKYQKNQTFFNEFREHVISQNGNLDLFCIEGSSVMAAYGIREANDLDFIHCSREYIESDNKYISNHNDESIYHVKTRDDLIFNPENYFYYKGIKFLTLENLYSMKRKRGEIKDIDDCSLIGKFTEKNGFSQFNLFSILIEKKVRYLIFRVSRKVNKIVRWKVVSRKSSTVIEQLRSIAFKIVRKTYRNLILLCDSFKPAIRTISYKNFCLYYSEGTSIVEGNSSTPVRFGGTYEPPETNSIVNVLKRSKKPTFLDIGANIGLVSLNVLHEVPTSEIFAFEPGSHQHSLFEKTIKTNILEDRITLYQLAVGMQRERHSFSLHNGKHSSGDGFFDTGRAGNTEKCSVEVIDLDSWWETVEFKKIDVIKIDIEGAELWALKGGSCLINSCKPTVVLEIHPINLKPYPYSAFDILSWLEDHKYQLKTISGKPVNFDNLDNTLSYESSFIASPC